MATIILLLVRSQEKVVLDVEDSSAEELQTGSMSHRKESPGEVENRTVTVLGPQSLGFQTRWHSKRTRIAGRVRE